MNGLSGNPPPVSGKAETQSCVSDFVPGALGHVMGSSGTWSMCLSGLDTHGQRGPGLPQKHQNGGGRYVTPRALLSSPGTPRDCCLPRKVTVRIKRKAVGCLTPSRHSADTSLSYPPHFSIETGFPCVWVVFIHLAAAPVVVELLVDWLLWAVLSCEEGPLLSERGRWLL